MQQSRERRDFTPGASDSERTALLVLILNPCLDLILFFTPSGAEGAHAGCTCQSLNGY